MSAAPLPKRWETILTSSGCETKSAILRLLFRVLNATIQHHVHLFRGQVLMKIVVHLHCRRPTARADALNFFQRENAVWRGLLVADAQPLFAVLIKLFSAAQHAGDIGA